MRRPLSLALAGLLAAGLVPPGPVRAASDPVAGPVDVTDAVEDTPYAITLTGSDADGDATDGFTVPATTDRGGTLGPVGAITCDGGAPTNTCTASVLYTPPADFNAAIAPTDGFSYTATAGGAESAPASVSIAVQAVNDAPSFTVGADQVVAEDVGPVSVPGFIADGAVGPPTALDEVGAQSLTYAVTVPPGDQGLFTVQPAVDAAGILAFSTAPDAHGSTTVTVAAGDGLDTSADQSFSITITAVNDAPVCPADTPVTTAEDAPLDGALACTDVDGDPLAYAKAGDPAHGTVSVAGDGTFRYAPAGDYAGADAFGYTASDGVASPAAGSVGVTVTPVNDAPACTGPVTVTTNEDTTATGTLACTDAEGSTLTYAKVAGPSHGTATVASGGAWSYVPAANYGGPDAFTFRANDGTVNGATVTVSITVTAVNDTPVCLAASPVTTAEDTAASGTVSCSDVETAVLTWTRAVNAAHGTATVGAGGAWTYAPAANYAGPDQFTVRASDGVAGATVVVSITVTPVNDAPTCAAVAARTIAEDTPASGTIACTDVEGGALIHGIDTGPAHGTLRVGSGTWTYTPTANYNGTDSFSLVASDGARTSVPRTVSVTITPVNDPPDARNDARTVNATTTTTLDVLANDGAGGTTPGGTPEAASALRITAVTAAGKGTATITGNGTTLSYDPRACATGSDLFTYTVTDGQYTDTATVVVTIAVPGTNGLPLAPITDEPAVTLAPLSTIGTGTAATVPARISWCGVPAGGRSIRDYDVGASTNAGSTWSALLTDTTARSLDRTLRPGTAYRWRVRSRDSAGVTGTYRPSAVSTVAVVQDASGAWTWTGTWKTASSTSYSGGTARTTTAVGARATVTRSGRLFAIVARRSTVNGSFEVWVDGARVATVQTRISTTGQFRRIVWVRALTSGSHVIEVRKTVADGAVHLDALVTIGP